MKIFIDVFCGMRYQQLFPLAKKVGFNGFFSGELYANDANELGEIKTLAQLHHMEWETSHSTIPNSPSLWSKGSLEDDYCKQLFINIDNCKKYAIPMLVVHVAPDFSNDPCFDVGVLRLEAVVAYAKKAGVKIAFENINSAEYLLKTLAYFDDPSVGFCYDCGHEACYTPSVRYLTKIGQRLFCTHLHDNDLKGDWHRLPFDGSIDFEKMSQELKECNYRGNLTLELSYNDSYQARYTPEEFIKEAYIRVDRLRKQITQ